jgi:hypothetical protein
MNLTYLGFGDCNPPELAFFHKGWNLNFHDDLADIRDRLLVNSLIVISAQICEAINFGVMYL